MLINVIIWVYIFITTYALGGLFIYALERNKPNVIGDMYRFEDISIIGMVIATVYAQFFSLFMGVGLVANIILILVSAFFYLYVLPQNPKDFFQSFSLIKKIPGFLFLVLIILVMSFCSSRGYFHIDSDLYHGQAIHWIEDYGVVKGLGLLHGRLAYNSSSFALQALYSFSFMGGRSYHACAGYYALMVFLSCAKIVHVFKDRRFLLSDFTIIASIYYINNIYDEISSPASDYFTMLTIAYIAIKLTEGIEKKADNDWFSICSLLAFFSLTLKLSAAPLVIITLIPFIFLIKGKYYKKLVFYMISAVLIVLPFFIRNYIISGWLLYPSVSIDLFNPYWKISRESAMIDKAYIIAFGRGFSDMGSSEISFVEWFPHWFSLLGKTEMVLFIGGIVGSLLWTADLLVDVLKKATRNYEVDYYIFSYVISFSFWLLSSPLVRYGQGYLLITPLLTFGRLYCLSEHKIGMTFYKKTGIAVTALISLFFLYKSVALIGYIKTYSYQPYYIQPQDYGVYETYTVNVGGECEIYVPLYGALTGYYDFPSAPENVNLPELADPEAKDFSGGFK